MSTSNDTTRKRPSAEPATTQSDQDATATAGTSAASERTNADDEDEDEWRHEPVAPVDERNPLKSLGRAIADVATSGSEPGPKPKRPDR